MRKPFFATIMAVLAFSGFLWAPAAAEPRGSLRVAIATMPNSLDVPVAAERQATTTAWHLYNSLTWLDDSGKPVPALAESWTVSEDGTTYTFQLRKGVTFHNGEPFTADSVVFSWKRGKGNKMQWKKKWAMAKSVEKVDDYTVRVRTDGPNPILLRVIADYWAMVPPKYIAKVGEKGFAKHPVGTGPFRFVEWKKGDRIVFEANPDYWEKGLPKIKKLIFRPIPESSTRVAAIRTGEVDIVGRLSSEEAGTLKGLKNIKVITYPVDRVYYIAFNNMTSGKGTPVENREVRLAMNYAVDVDAILDALFEGHGRPLTGFVTYKNLGYDKDLKPYGYDVKKAKALMKKAGYEKGFKIDFACPAGAYTNFEQVCQAIQGYLGDIGVEADLKIMESGKYWDLEAKKELPPMFGDSWSESSGESLPRLQGALGGKSASFSAWEDPKILDYLKKIGTTVDDGARAKLYVELQRYMYENPPFIYLYQPVAFEAINVKVKNYKPRPPENYFLKDTWIEE